MISTSGTGYVAMAAWALATAAWPSGEFGGMGLEGAFRLGCRRELAAVADPAERARVFEARGAELYERGKAVNSVAALEIRTVIDPAGSRDRFLAALVGCPAAGAPPVRRYLVSPGTG